MYKILFSIMISFVLLILSLPYVESIDPFDPNYKRIFPVKTQEINDGNVIVNSYCLVTVRYPVGGLLLGKLPSMY